MSNLAILTEMQSPSQHISALLVLFDLERDGVAFEIDISIYGLKSATPILVFDLPAASLAWN